MLIHDCCPVRWRTGSSTHEWPSNYRVTQHTNIHWRHVGQIFQRKKEKESRTYQTIPVHSKQEQNIVCCHTLHIRNRGQVGMACAFEFRSSALKSSVVGAFWRTLPSSLSLTKFVMQNFNVASGLLFFSSFWHNRTSGW